MHTILRGLYYNGLGTEGDGQFASEHTALSSYWGVDSAIDFINWASRSSFALQFISINNALNAFSNWVDDLLLEYDTCMNAYNVQVEIITNNYRVELAQDLFGLNFLLVDPDFNGLTPTEGGWYAGSALAETYQAIADATAEINALSSDFGCVG